MTATFLPVGSGGAANASLLAIAYSPRKCSTELMPTWSSTSLRLQPVSHGAGQTRPITDGNGLASVSRRHAYSCQLHARGRLFDAAHDVEIAADVLARRAAALARRRRLDVGRALVRVARLEDLVAPGVPLRVAILVAAERELFRGCALGWWTSPGLRNVAGQCFAPSLDGRADELMHAADHAHLEAVVGQHLRELRLADRADRRHEIDAVRVDDLLQRLHPRQRALDPQVEELVGQQTAAAAAAERLLRASCRAACRRTCWRPP